MFYIKNLPTGERVARVTISIVAAIAGATHFGLGLYGLMIIASSVMFAVTGFVGWCPMCAMAGRKIAKKS